MVRVNGNNSGIFFDRERAGVVFSAMLQAYYNKEQLFSEGLVGKFASEKMFPAGVPPKGIKPGSNEHAIWLFFMNQLDKRMDSAVLYSKGRELFEDHPELIDPENIAFYSNLEGLLRRYLGEDKASNAEQIRHNFARFAGASKGSMREVLYRDISSARENLKSFEGYGEGLANLFLTYCMKYRIAEFRNPEELLPKIDFHDINICFSTRVISFEGRAHKDILRRKLQQDISLCCQETGKKAYDLDEAMWAVGSKLCARRNKSLCYDLCPVSPHCTRNMPVSYYKTGFVDANTDVKPQQLALELRTT